MEERGNKTVVCSVLFLDIVEYSRKPVAAQIVLRERFNDYLSAAIHDVPVADRIILDAGDGFAISFLGDVGDALTTTLHLRESLLNEDPNLEQRLLVRMGINLGPVRLARDANGLPTIVGDGINVAQRVMDFADASQILVSRSYYDAALRRFPQYAGWFHYQGSRTDKHVREHEIFAIGYPGDETLAAPVGRRSGGRARLGRAGHVWHTAATWLDMVVARQYGRFRAAGPRQRGIYVGTAAVSLGVLLALLLKLTGPGEMFEEPVQGGSASSAASAVPPTLGLRFSATLDTVPVEVSGVPATSATDERKQETTVPGYNPWRELRDLPEPDKSARKNPPSGSNKQQAAETERGINFDQVVRFLSKHLGPQQSGVASGSDATVMVDCTDGATVYVDGQKKGTVSSGTMSFPLTVGRHLIEVNDMTRGNIYSEEVLLEAGKTFRIKPNLCL